ncbi:MAG: hypothetical protein IJB02_04940 [Oscillospiraceae bacterium]|nr:hypothetical protein [Oscillospiraceae bacterium]
MDDLQARMGAILNDPEMMKKISAMAQSLSAPQEPQVTKPPEMPNMSNIPSIDPGLLQKLAGFAGQTGIDNNQKTLLHALNPYLSRERINKLERAMRAASMARMASVFLGR